jgi:hypothetical protein
MLAALDHTIVSTALPTICDLAGLSHLSWVVTACLLASTVSGPLYGEQLCRLLDGWDPEHDEDLQPILRRLAGALVVEMAGR